MVTLKEKSSESFLWWELTDFTKIYDHGVKHGYGTEKAQRHLATWLRDMKQSQESDQRPNLFLSTNSRFSSASAKGKAKAHNLQCVALKVISREFSGYLD